MTINTEDMINSILASLSRIDYIKPEDIPSIDLYMDQVTTFMDENLKASKRYDTDKILTKTMINNYTKNNLLPPSLKKKYSKEHLLILIFIYYFKNILSISDIQTLLEPITKKYFDTKNSLHLEDIYKEVFALQKEQVDVLKNDVLEKYNRSTSTFENSSAKDQHFLQQFSFICMLSFDVYVKKQLIEKLIDELPEATGTPAKNKADRK